MRAGGLARLGVWFAVSVWGASFVAADSLLRGTSHLTPVVLAAARFSLAALFFAVPLARAIGAGQIRLSHVLKMAVMGLTGYTMYFWLQYTGVADTNAAVASILVVGLVPIMTAVSAYALGQERLTLATLMALTLGLVGVILIVAGPHHGSVVSWSSTYVFGGLCLIANAVLWAVNSTLSKAWMRDPSLPPLVLTGGSMAFGALGLVLASVMVPAAEGWNAVWHLSAAGWANLLFLSVVCGVAGYLLYNYALTQIRASEAASYIYFEPVVAVALGIAFLHERLEPATVAGAALLAIAAAALTRLRAAASGVTGVSTPAVHHK